MHRGGWGLGTRLQNADTCVSKEPKYRGLDGEDNECRLCKHCGCMLSTDYIWLHLNTSEVKLLRENWPVHNQKQELTLCGLMATKAGPLKWYRQEMRNCYTNSALTCLTHASTWTNVICFRWAWQSCQKYIPSLLQYWPPNTILIPRLLVLFSLVVLHTLWIHACMQKFGDFKFSEVKFFKNRVKFGIIYLIFRTIKEWITQPLKIVFCKVTHCAGCVLANTRPHQASSAALWWTGEDGNPWFLGPWVPITMKIWGLRHKIYIDIVTPIHISMIHRYCDPHPHIYDI